MVSDLDRDGAPELLLVGEVGLATGAAAAGGQINSFVEISTDFSTEFL